MKKDSKNANFSQWVTETHETTLYMQVNKIFNKHDNVDLEPLIEPEPSK